MCKPGRGSPMLGLVIWERTWKNKRIQNFFSVITSFTICWIYFCTLVGRIILLIFIYRGFSDPRRDGCDVSGVLSFCSRKNGLGNY
jgi:hypothetical protein